MSTNDQPQATHRAAFEVTIAYNVIAGEPTPEKLAEDLREAIAHDIKNHALDEVSLDHYHAYGCNVVPMANLVHIASVGGVAPVGTTANLAKPNKRDPDNYSDCEVDAALCVFDELIGMVTWAFNKRKFKQSDASEDKKAFALYVESLQQDLGTPHLRTLSMELGRVIESIWRELQDLELSEHWDGAWDFEYVPDVLYNAWLVCREFPESESRVQWLAASLQALGYTSTDIKDAIKEKALKDYPELGAQLLHISNTYRDILDRVGADVLSQYTSEPSSTLADELNALSRAFTK